MPFVVAYVTFPNMDEAHRITDTLLERRLIACANLLPVESKYWWNGRMERCIEVAAILKTTRKNWPRLKAQVERMHSYEVPDITMVMAQANGKYEKWVAAQARAPR